VVAAEWLTETTTTKQTRAPPSPAGAGRAARDALKLFPLPKKK